VSCSAYVAWNSGLWYGP